MQGCVCVSGGWGGLMGRGEKRGAITKKLKRVFGIWMQSSAIEMIPGAWQVEGNRCAGGWQPLRCTGVRKKKKKRADSLITDLNA